MTDVRAMLETNRRMWDERVAVHLAPGGYDLAELRAGKGRLAAIEEQELAELFGPLEGRRVLHLQCHFGADSLTLAQRGATVVGVDFSPPAIAAARRLAVELELTEQASFVECNVLDAPEALGDQPPFDLVFSSWGTIGWLPDIERWAKVAAVFLTPGGLLYLLDGHPSALVFDDAAPGEGDRPGWFAPYFRTEALVLDDAEDYANPAAPLQQRQSFAWMHGLGRIASAMLAEGLQITALREHDRITWRVFQSLEKGPDGMYRWPAERWLPLAFTLAARRPA